MEYWSVREASQAWGVSERWVQKLLSEGRIPGAGRQGRRWFIPVNSPRPVDARKYRYMNVSDALAERFAVVDSLRAEMERRRPLTRDELDRLRKEFAIEYTYDSNAIEGSTLTLRETALILEGVTIGEKPLKEHLEAVGHRDAYAYVEDTAAQIPLEPLTSRIIRNIHFLVLADKPTQRGAFRTVAVRILGSAHKPPEPIRVPELVDDLLAVTTSNRCHPLENAALFHLKFEAIHPFIDGNGRTGRLLLNLMLLQAGYLPINIKYADRQQYYHCFQVWDDDQNPEPMIALVTRYAEQQLRDWLAILDTAL